MVNLKGNPFLLNDESVRWVKQTLDSMNVEEKIGQLFCPMGMSGSKKTIKHLTEDIKVGGIMFRPTKGTKLQEIHRNLQEASKIPLLIAANLEAGGNGAIKEGTSFSMPMGVAATNDVEMGYKLGKVSCAEGAAVGVNWAFAPIVDIDMNFRNPITNLRTFGSNVDTVIKMSKGYLEAAKEENLAVSIKHFPGDGVDERDQHLLTSVNSLSVKEWDKTYGAVYRTLISEGAKTVMVGHIALPAWVEKQNAQATKEVQYMPASLSPEILQGLLRKELNFNGLVVTDASLMVGFTSAMLRKDAVPATIANGCDMFLFNKSLDEDFAYMLAGYKNGVLTDARLDEAVTRILATKASLNLPLKHASRTIVPNVSEIERTVGKGEHKAWAKVCAQQAVTLVKDTQELLPLSVKRHKRLLLNVIERKIKKKSKFTKELQALLEKEGFEVTVRDRTANIDLEKMMSGRISLKMVKSLKEAMSSTSEFTSTYDACLIVANIPTQSNESTIRLQFDALANDIPWFVKEVPTAFISFGNPYHLLDVPMIKTAINAYTANSDTLEATIKRLVGKAEFTGISPVDPFCGHEDTKL